MLSSLQIKHHNVVLAALSVVVGLLFTLSNYTSPGAGNSAEDLPQLMRLITPEYLSNDHFVNAATSSFSIRTLYFGALVETLKVLGVFQGLFIGALIFNILTLYVVAHFTFRLSGKSRLAAMVSVVLASGVTFAAADSYRLLGQEMLANYPSMLLVFLAIYVTLMKERLTITASALLGTAALIQPLNAIIGFAVCMGAGVTTRALQHGRFDVSFLRTRAFWLNHTIATMIFAAMLAPVLIAYLTASGDQLTNDQFVQIYGYFRIPHHAVPTVFFSLDQFMPVLLYLLALTLILFFSSRLSNLRTTRHFIVGVGLLFGVFAIANFVFVEVIPTRIFVTLVPVMKISPVIALFGVVLVSGYITEPELDVRKVIVVGLVVLFMSFYDWQGMVSALFIVLVIAYVQWAKFEKLILLSALRKVIRVVIAAALVGSALFVAVGSPNIADRLTSLSRRIAAPADTPDTPLYAFVQENTPADEVFVVPHNMTTFRLETGRAVVVLFKTYPPNDTGLLEWYERMQDSYTCYDGTVHGIVPGPQGFAFASEYTRIDDDCLLNLHTKYGATYAVLYAETVTSFPVLYEDERYKLIAIATGRQTRAIPLTGCSDYPCLG